ncbi:MAG: hypothetical protein M3286_03860 [Thermoproteota archaeon]|nr:hypothetical protein [Thermoproteota archaeon]
MRSREDHQADKTVDGNPSQKRVENAKNHPSRQGRGVKPGLKSNRARGESRRLQPLKKASDNKD